MPKSKCACGHSFFQHNDAERDLIHAGPCHQVIDNPDTEAKHQRIICSCMEYRPK